MFASETKRACSNFAFYGWKWGEGLSPVNSSLFYIINFFLLAVKSQKMVALCYGDIFFLIISIWQGSCLVILLILFFNFVNEKKILHISVIFLNTDPDPSIIKQKDKLWFLLFCDFFMTFYLKNYKNAPSKSNKNLKFRKTIIFCWRLEVRGMDPRIRIHTKISWIPNAVYYGNSNVPVLVLNKVNDN